MSKTDIPCYELTVLVASKGRAPQNLRRENSGPEMICEWLQSISQEVSWKFSLPIDPLDVK